MRLVNYSISILIYLISIKICYPINCDSLYSTGKLQGFSVSPYFDEQIDLFNYTPDIRVLINAPCIKDFNPEKPVELVLYALPNGNTIEQTIGKKTYPDDDWHYNIQHIGAQTRFLRNTIKDKNLVVVYLETKQKSWPKWKSENKDYPVIINNLVKYLTEIFREYNPVIVLTGHSGGGSFTFGFLDSVDEIPENIKRISFLDSDYGYDDNYGNKILNWIVSSPDNFLNVIAYNDSIALYNGKTFVSPTGGTWYRSKMMLQYLLNYMKFNKTENEELIKYTALNNRVQFILKSNPDKQIFHTIQVELNGFIQGLLSGTALEEKGYKYFGDRVYEKYIQDEKELP